MCSRVKPAPKHSASVTAIGSTASARCDPSRGTIILVTRTLIPSEELLVQQIEVEADDERGHQTGYYSGGPAVHQRAHEVLALGKHDERYQGKRDTEAQHHLAQDQRPCYIKANGEYK